VDPGLPYKPGPRTFATGLKPNDPPADKIPVTNRLSEHFPVTDRLTEQMTNERTTAYRRVMKTLEDLGPSKLFADEQDRIRYAADSLIFCSALERDDAALEALTDIELLSQALVDSGRWEQITAMRLRDDVSQCGPRPVPALTAA
jgi:hypothetical protein